MDIELFANVFFPHYCSSPFNPFHRDLFSYWKQVTERGRKRVTAAPRGYAKSTFVTLIKPIHDICYGLEKYIVILSDTQNQAIGKLKALRSEILTNKTLTDFYGLAFDRKRPAESRFVVNGFAGDTQCEAYGSGTEIRGIRYNQWRPTKIILDDSEDSEAVYNEELRGKLEDWFYQVVSKVGTKDTNIEFVGTMLHRKSLLKTLLDNPVYEGKLYRAIIAWNESNLWRTWESMYMNVDDDDRKHTAKAFFENNKEEMLEGHEILWPENESYYDLMIEILETGRRNFFKEKQNDPLGAEDSVFERFHFYREHEQGMLLESSNVLIPHKHLEGNAYGTLDPATGQTKAKKGKQGDFSCLLSGYLEPKGRLLVHMDDTKREPPTKFIQRIFDNHELLGYNKFGVETNLYRNLLLQNIVMERKRREKETGKLVKIPFYDIENVDNKEKRIYTLEPKVTHGWIVFNKSLSREFMHQLQDFPHADHDDCPDSLEMLWGLTHKQYKPSPISLDAIGST